MAKRPVESESEEMQEMLPDLKLCPKRLRGLKQSLIQKVNEDYFAMLKDHHRNEFYWNAMANVGRHRVLDIGAGTGLLSLMAAKRGATVLSVEESADMAELVRESARHNGLEQSIRVLDGHSTAIDLPDEEKADLIVSETFGVLLLQEGCLRSFVHGRERLLLPCTPFAASVPAVVPCGGAQAARLLGSAQLRKATGGAVPAELRHMARWRDTGRVHFSAPGGFCVNAIDDALWMSDRLYILEVDFTSSSLSDIPSSREFVLHALQDGYVDAVVLSWEVWADKEKSLKLTTHAEDTKDKPWGFSRDAHWGQGFQFLESNESLASAFYVTAGEELRLTVRWADDGSSCQCSVARDSNVPLHIQQHQDDQAEAAEATATVPPALPQAPVVPASCGAAVGVKPFEPLWLEEAAIPLLCDAEAGDFIIDRRLYEEDLPANFLCNPNLKGSRSIFVQTLNDDYFAFLNHEKRLNFFHSAIKAMMSRWQIGTANTHRAPKVLDLGCGAGQLSVLANQMGASVVAVEASSEFCHIAEETFQNAGFNGGNAGNQVQMIHALSCCVEFDEKMDVILCEPYDIFLTGDGGSGSLDYLIDARQRLAVKAEVIPSGGAQFARLLMSSELGMRSMDRSVSDISLKNLGRLVDSVSLVSSRKKGFRWSRLPDLVLMSKRVQLFELDFQTMQRKDIPRKRSLEIECLQDGFVDAVVTSWEVWAGPNREHRFETHAEETRDDGAWSFNNDVVFGQGLQLILEEG
ncbi:unnamed protein product, partial [Durusdinium trenchii]